MIIEKVLGNVNDAAFTGRTVDILDINWYNTHKKIGRQLTRGNLDIGIHLDPVTLRSGLNQDDVVADDGETIVVVNILEAPCLHILPKGDHQLIKVSYEIGNRHAPFFFAGGQQGFLVPFDKPMMRMIQGLGIQVEEMEAKLLPENRISSAHGQGHSHGHDEHHSHSHDEKRDSHSNKEPYVAHHHHHHEDSLEGHHTHHHEDSHDGHHTHHHEDSHDEHRPH